MSVNSLRAALRRLDGGSYGALKSLVGSYDGRGHRLVIDRVQSDPYAPPSKIRVLVPLAATGLPADLLGTVEDRRAVRDFIARDIADAVAQGSREFGFVAPGQEILDRSSVVFAGDWVEVRLTFAFPASGRRVRGRQAEALLADDVPDLVEFSALGSRLDIPALRAHVGAHRAFVAIQRGLEERGLVAFVADGSALPRRAGNDDRPLAGALPFSSPESLRVAFDLPDGRTVTGMGIQRGVTVLVGGGFHGKSTLLAALGRGVYPHIPGDGRELVVTAASAVAVRAEDGRAVTSLDISAFIRDLPTGQDTRSFSTANASGSTSQAANTVEALEAGSRLLLLDEDTCATNFMVRDELMGALIEDSAEPIKPLVGAVQALAGAGVSTVIVMGGSGAFLSEADTVLALRNFEVQNVTARARELADSSRFGRAELPAALTGASAGAGRDLAPLASALAGGRGRPPRARGREQVQLPAGELDLRYVAQLVDAGQTAALALLLPRLVAELREGTPLAQACQQAVKELEAQGFTGLGAPRGDLVAPRPYELAAAVNRLRVN